MGWFFVWFKKLHPPKLTWHLKIDPWKRRFLVENPLILGSMLVFWVYRNFLCFFCWEIPEFKVESRCGAAGAAFGGLVHFEKLVGEWRQNHHVFWFLKGEFVWTTLPKFNIAPEKLPSQ